MTDLRFFEELPIFLEHCGNAQCSIVIAGDFHFHFEDVSNSNTKKFRDLLTMHSLVHTVSEPTHGRGYTLDPVFHRDSDNFIHSTRTCHDLTSDPTVVLCPPAVPKPTETVKDESIRCISKINMDNFSVDIANGITPDISLTDLNRHRSKVLDKQSSVVDWAQSTNQLLILDKHAPVCQRKVRQPRRPSAP